MQLVQKHPDIDRGYHEYHEAREALIKQEIEHYKAGIV
jgi:hypothetical protein